MNDHHFTGAELFLAELATGTFVGHLLHDIAQLPGWVGGLGGGLVVGVLLRLLDPTLKAHGERIKPWLTPHDGTPRVLPPPPPRKGDPPDDPDATG